MCPWCDKASDEHEDRRLQQQQHSIKVPKTQTVISQTIWPSARNTFHKLQPAASERPQCVAAFIFGFFFPLGLFFPTKTEVFEATHQFKRRTSSSSLRHQHMRVRAWLMRRHGWPQLLNHLGNRLSNAQALDPSFRKDKGKYFLLIEKMIYPESTRGWTVLVRCVLLPAGLQQI